MRAVYLTEKKVLVEKDIPKPVPKDNEVLIQVKSVGVCGSDVHYWEHGQIGKFVVEQPMILGHEMSGVVAGLGKNVANFKVGDRVIVEPGTPCYHCDYCKTGRYNLCPDIVFYATPPVDGALAEYVVHDSSLVFKIPESLSYDMATLAEPQAVGVAAIRRAGLKMDEKVIIYGAGIIGLCTMFAAQAAGAQSVTLVDVRQDRLDMAKRLGADRVVNAKNEQAPEGAYDLAFECSGVPASLADAGRTVKIGGRIVLIGLGGETFISAPIVNFIINEQNLITVFRYANAHPSALNIVEKGSDKLSALITHRYTLDETEKAINTARYDPTAIKVIIEVSK